MRSLADLAARRQLLIAQADFDRMKLTLALHDVRGIVRPHAAPARRSAMRDTASRILRFALPVLGVSRAGRVVRVLSIGLAVYRFVHALRERR